MEADFDPLTVNRETVIAMLSAEQALRYSEAVQDQYDHGQPSDDPEGIEKAIQRQVLAQFGFTSTPQSLGRYQSLGYHYRDDPEVLASVNYLRLNIIIDCPLKVGEPMVEARLYDLAGQEVSLLGLMNPGRPMVILSGSLT